jgi:xanthine dehydrogenase accessory factor
LPGVSRADLLERADRLRAGRVPFVLATVVRAERPTSAKAGDSALVLPDGTVEGFVGGTCAESTVRLQGLRLLESGESTLLRITPEPSESESAVEGLVTVGNPCLSGGTLEIFLEATIPRTLVHVVGDAPVARALVEVGRALGWDLRPLGESTAGLAPDASRRGSRRRLPRRRRGGGARSGAAGGRAVRGAGRQPAPRCGRYLGAGRA